MQQTETAPSAPRAKGRWTKKTNTLTYLCASDKVDVHTFTADSGYKAVMKRTPGHRKEPYTAEIHGLDGHIAARINQNGHRVTGMTMHLNLKDAKETVEEAVHQVEEHGDTRTPTPVNPQETLRELNRSSHPIPRA